VLLKSSKEKLKKMAPKKLQKPVKKYENTDLDQVKIFGPHSQAGHEFSKPVENTNSGLESGQKQANETMSK
jgi:hypothetical protein